MSPPSPSPSPSMLEPAPLTAAGFAPFGDVIETGAAREERSINNGCTTRYHDLAQLTLDAAGGRPCLSIFRTTPLPTPLLIEVLERHPRSSQAFQPLSGRPWLVVVAPAGELDPAAVRAFRAGPDQGVNFHPGTWHHFSLALGATSDFLVLDRDGDDADCDEARLPRPLRIDAPGVLGLDH